MFRSSYDAIVVGARCAGAATAMLMARGGARVLLIDRAPEIGDTLSTHALMRPAVTLLDRWGVRPEIAARTPMIDRTDFVYGDETISVPVKPRTGSPGLYAPRRMVLDRALAAAAVRAGAELRLGTAFDGVERGADGQVIGAVLQTRRGQVRVRAPLVIGADGRQSAVAAAFDAHLLAQGRDASAVLYTYVASDGDTGYRWFYAPGIAAGIIPSTGGRTCVFVSCAAGEARARLGGPPEAAMARALERWLPDLAARIAAGGAVERVRRFFGATGHIRMPRGPGWALVGDAAYFKDPITAHGISDAFLDADRLAHAALASPGTLAAYGEAGGDAQRAFFELTNAVARYDWTMDDIRALHLRINAVLKAEEADLAARSGADRATAA